MFEKKRNYEYNKKKKKSFKIFTGFLQKITNCETISLFFVYGIANLFHKKVKEGLICMVIGIAVVLFAWLLTEIIMASFGVLIIIKGILDLAAALKTKKVFSIIFSITGPPTLFNAFIPNKI